MGRLDTTVYTACMWSLPKIWLCVLCDIASGPTLQFLIIVFDDTGAYNCITHAAQCMSHNKHNQTPSELRAFVFTLTQIG